MAFILLGILLGVLLRLHLHVDGVFLWYDYSRACGYFRF